MSRLLAASFRQQDHRRIAMRMTDDEIIALHVTVRSVFCAA